ncbi:hypothetical protein D9615_007410 [Tricholomella constricta]|uniref:Uncharacterized protein n=1 Tax=Tricholomella constricta TaxID=117010 RepID=A0A8H5GXV2_9AGAR|nr:hypothetical protein D9615_007410 [Tricholomella constricta]
MAQKSIAGTLRVLLHGPLVLISPDDRHVLAADAIKYDATVQEDVPDNRHDDYRPSSSSEKSYPTQHPTQQRLHLPPISHPPLNPQPSHGMYDTGSHMSHMGPGSHYYYHPQQNMMGPGQPPQPVIQPYTMQHDQRPVAYYPAIDPNIDNDSSASGSNVYSNHSNHGQNQNTGHLGR